VSHALRRILLALACVALAACRHRSPTELRIIVESDLAAATVNHPDNPLVGVHLFAAFEGAAGGGPLVDQTFAFPPYALPGDVVITPPDPNDPRRIIVHATAMLSDGSTFSFDPIVPALAPYTRTILPIRLDSRCRDVRCPAGQTCGRDGCQAQVQTCEDGGCAPAVPPDADATAGSDAAADVVVERCNNLGPCAAGQVCRFELCWWVNDECENAQPIVLQPGRVTRVSGAFAMMMAGVAGQSIQSCRPASDVFFTFTLARTELVSIQVVAEPTDALPSVGIVEGPCYARNTPPPDADLGVDCGQRCGGRNEITRVLGPGTHLLVVDADASDHPVTPTGGAYTLEIHHLPVVDALGGALPAGPISLSGDFASAASGGACRARPTRWFYWTTCDTAAAGTLDVASCGSADLGFQLRHSDGAASACGVGCPFASAVPAGAGIHVLEMAAGSGAGAWTLTGTRP
jgi:hypothetical protein